VGEMGTLFQELHPNLLIHLLAKNDLYLSINMAQLLTFNPIMCSNFSLCFVAELQMDDFSEYKISFTVFLVSVFRNNGLWDNGNGFVGRGLCRHFYLSENACIL
jgi:hypothetical protein